MASLTPFTSKFSILIYLDYSAPTPWQFLYFFPLPHGHGSFLPTLFSTRMGCVFCGSRVSSALPFPPSYISRLLVSNLLRSRCFWECARCTWLGSRIGS